MQNGYIERFNRTYREEVLNCYIFETLAEVRRMTAAVGFPTLRLLRVQIGNFAAPDLPPGQWRKLDPAARARVLADPA